MGKFSTEDFELEYTPKLTASKFAKVLSLHFPEYEQVWPFTGDGIALKKRPYALACICIIHREKKNKTIVRVYGGMSPLSMIYAGRLWYLFAIGDLVDRVEDVVRQELPNILKEL